MLNFSPVLYDHNNKIVKILSVLKPRNVKDFTEIYVEFELMETDLATIIRSSQALTDQHVQVRIKVMLRPHR